MEVLKVIDMNSMTKKIIRFMGDPDYRFLISASTGMYNNMDDAEYLRHIFKARVGYDLNLVNPITFNEKIQWLKLNDRNPKYTTMVDKAAAKDFAASIIGKQHIIPTYGVWDQYDDIPFDQLPEQFVLKTTHDTGGVVICGNKKTMDHRMVKKKLTKHLKNEFFFRGREWPYKGVKPQIIAEELLRSEDQELKDYKVLCFNGQPSLIQVHWGRFSGKHKMCYYDTDWKQQNYENQHTPRGREIQEKPAFLHEMLDFSARLSEGIPFLRVDWYVCHSQLYLGELTFFDAGGFYPFVDYSMDIQLGQMIRLLIEEQH